MTNKIPKELRDIEQWVSWKAKKMDNKKFSKIPINPNKKKFEPAKVSDPQTWGSYSKSIDACKRHNLDGPGFVFTENDPFVGIDIDNCRNPEKRTIKKWAMKIVRDMNSYTEISPSGKGLHIIVKAILPNGNRKGNKIEIYNHGRYFTVTGKHLKGTPKNIHERDKEIKNLYEETFAQAKPKIKAYEKPPSADWSDKKIIMRAKKAKNGSKFKQLWDGNIDNYSSHSEADSALCRLLCFWVGHDANRLDKLFRKSKLYRDKWDKQHSSKGKTYGEITIEAVMKDTKEFYNLQYEKDYLMKIAKEAELFKSPLLKAYATIPVANHFEVWPVKSQEFGNWLRHMYFEANNDAPKKTDFNDVLDYLTAKAQFDSPEHELYIRVAEYKNEIFIDLANDEWEVIKINEEGWEITKKYPVKFIRPSGMFPLPHPQRDGNFNKLISLLNINEIENWVLLISWLLGAIHPIGPYPILLIMGDHGSAKSMKSRLLRTIIDPSKSPLRSIPRSERDLMISASNSWVLVFDNLSSIKSWFSDALCRLATGGGLTTRQLHTDAKEMFFNSTRPILINGIDVIAYNHDLIDRCIIIYFSRIKNKDRRTESEILKEFEKAQPSILGALCNAVSEALKNLPNIQAPNLPRMADFAKWIIAAEPALPWPDGDFIKYYQENQAQSIIRSLGADPVAEAIQEMMKVNKTWKGTATKLLNILEGNDTSSGFVSENIINSKAWPKAPHILSGRIKKASTFLNTVGIEVEFLRGSQRMILITRK